MVHDPDLRAALTLVARVPRLLVASDYDGVLAPIVTDPAQAVPLPGGIAALTDLAGLPDTAVALVSGRARADLAALSGAPPTLTLVGSHGAEFEHGFTVPLTEEQLTLHERLRAALEELVDGRAGVWLETKPASVVVHTRTAPRDVAAEVMEAVRRGPATWSGVHPTTGKEVIELSVSSADKGTAIDTLRAQVSADAVVYLGDDVTDENAFARLREGDVGVKVGPGDTLARYRLSDPPAVVGALTTLYELRRAADSASAD